VSSGRTSVLNASSFHSISSMQSTKKHTINVSWNSVSGDIVGGRTPFLEFERVACDGRFADQMRVFCEPKFWRNLHDVVAILRLVGHFLIDRRDL
jgi:hypothetical protein